MVGLSRALFLIGRIDLNVSEILRNALSLSLMVTMSIGHSSIFFEMEFPVLLLQLQLLPLLEFLKVY